MKFSCVHPKKCYLCRSTEHSHRPGKVCDNSTLEILSAKTVVWFFFLISLGVSSPQLAARFALCGWYLIPRCLLRGVSLNFLMAFYDKPEMHGDERIEVGEWPRQLERDDDRRVEYLKEAMTNRDVLDYGCRLGEFY